MPFSMSLWIFLAVSGYLVTSFSNRKADPVCSLAKTLCTLGSCIISWTSGSVLMVSFACYYFYSAIPSKCPAISLENSVKNSCISVSPAYFDFARAGFSLSSSTAAMHLGFAIPLSRTGFYASFPIKSSVSHSYVCDVVYSIAACTSGITKGF